MAWNCTSWANADWSAIANVTDFQKAVNERQKALTGADAIGTLKAVGDDVQDHAWIEELQQWVEDHCGVFNFVVSHIAGAPRSSGCFEGETVAPFYMTLAEVFSAAGLGTATWRAYVTHPDDAGVDQERKIAPGDIIGPWLFEDLQAVLNVMVWTRAQATAHADGVDNYQWESQALGPGGWAAYKGWVEAMWVVGAGILQTDVAFFAANSFGEWENIPTGNPPPYDFEQWWRADLIRSCGKPSTEVYNYAKSEMDFYALPVAASVGTWDDYGDTWMTAGEGVFSFLETVANGDGDGTPAQVTLLGAWIGSLDIPNDPWCDDPQPVGAPPPYGAASNRGYQCADMIGVARYNITGGFVYQ